MRALRNALEFFGGVPAEVLSDRCSSLVLCQEEDGVRWQPGYLRFCEYYGFTPRACRPYRSRTKGKIERPIGYIRRSFWPANFTDLDDLNRQACNWRDGVANVRVHGTTREVPLERWQEEKLQPLPGGQFVLEEVEPRRVSVDCFVSWYSNRYSVPWNVVGHSVLVRENEKGLLTIEHKGQVVAVHQVMGGRYRTVVDRRDYRGLPMGSARSRQAVYASQLAPEVEVRPLDVYERGGDSPMNEAMALDRADAMLRELGFQRTLAEFDFSFQPSIDERQVRELATLGFIDNATNILILGPPGVGKTHLAVALGIEAIKRRISTYFVTAQELISDLRKAYLENRFERHLKLYTGPKLLILDEMTYLPIEPADAAHVFRVVAERYEKGSIIITSNVSYGNWGQLLGDAILASALLDRFLHHSVTINIRGQSYRLKDKLRAGVPLPTQPAGQGGDQG